MSFGLLGKKLSHSYSPYVHAMIGAYDYQLFDMEEDQLDDFFENGDFNGLNVTSPYKEAVMKYVTCDAISKKIGAVNTIYYKDGNLIGTNTDVFGFMYLLSLHQIDLANKKVLILGSGGASKTVQAVCNMCQSKKVFVASRTKSNEFVEYGNLPLDVDIIVNATPVGMYPNNDEKLVDLAEFTKLEAVIDLIYNPYKTKLLQQAEDLGVKWANGLSMLIAQATKAAKHFTGMDYISYNKQLITNIKAYKLNLVLVGMPGCGKTFIGEKLAEATQRKFVDIDREISAMTGKTIADIFKEDGEKYFRNIETELLKKYCKETDLVIATGGGTVLRKENRDMIQANSGVVFLERPLNELEKKGRPLSVDNKTVEKLYDERKPLYDATKSISVTNDNNYEVIVNRILDGLGEYYNV